MCRRSSPAGQMCPVRAACRVSPTERVSRSDRQKRAEDARGARFAVYARLTPGHRCRDRVPEQPGIWVRRPFASPEAVPRRCLIGSAACREPKDPLASGSRRASSSKGAQVALRLSGSHTGWVNGRAEFASTWSWSCSSPTAARSRGLFGSTGVSWQPIGLSRIGVELIDWVNET